MKYMYEVNCMKCCHFPYVLYRVSTQVLQSLIFGFLFVRPNKVVFLEYVLPKRFYIVLFMVSIEAPALKKFLPTSEVSVTYSYTCIENRN